MNARLVQPKDGVFDGHWGGYIIVFNDGEFDHRLLTEHGVRGFNIEVTVTVKDSYITFEEKNN